jgi:hypothetical protein
MQRGNTWAFNLRVRARRAATRSLRAVPRIARGGVAIRLRLAHRTVKSTEQGNVDTAPHGPVHSQSSSSSLLSMADSLLPPLPPSDGSFLWPALPFGFF